MKKTIYYTTDKPGAKKELILFFVITFAIMYGLGAVGLIFQSNIEEIFGPINDQNLYVAFLIYAPTVSGLILTAIFEKRAGLIALFKRAVFSSSPLWWAVSILIWPVMWIVYGLFTKNYTWNNLFAALPFALFSSRIFVDRGPLGEELGWRGFALPRLLQYHNPLVSTIILSILWGLFHVPAFLSAGTTQSTVNVVWWSLALIAVNFIMSWLYINGGGNWILAGILPHYLFNTSVSQGIVPLGPGTVGIMLLAVAIILVRDKNKFLKLQINNGQTLKGKDETSVLDNAG
jgi:membrane protease YdiL (CAAX protease family)